MIEEKHKKNFGNYSNFEDILFDVFDNGGENINLEIKKIDNDNIKILLKYNHSSCEKCNGIMTEFTINRERIMNNTLEQGLIIACKSCWESYKKRNENKSCILNKGGIIYKHND